MVLPKISWFFLFVPYVFSLFNFTMCLEWCLRSGIDLTFCSTASILVYATLWINENGSHALPLIRKFKIFSMIQFWASIYDIIFFFYFHFIQSRSFIWIKNRSSQPNFIFSEWMQFPTVAAHLDPSSSSFQLAFCWNHFHFFLYVFVSFVSLVTWLS